MAPRKVIYIFYYYFFFVTLHFKDRRSVAYSRLSNSGDDALVKGTPKYECVMCEKIRQFSFRVRAFSISWTRLSRSLEQARRTAALLRHGNRAATTELECDVTDTLSGKIFVAAQISRTNSEHSLRVFIIFFSL